MANKIIQITYTDQTAEEINNEIENKINNELKKENYKIFEFGIQSLPGVILGINGNNPIIIGRTGILYIDTYDYGEILSVTVNKEIFDSLRSSGTFYFRLDIIAKEVN